MSERRGRVSRAAGSARADPERAIAPSGRRTTMSVATAVARALGVAVGASHPIGGGDVGEGWRLELADGRTVYAKTRAGAPPGIFAAEAAGLRWLGAAVGAARARGARRGRRSRRRPARPRPALDPVRPPPPRRGGVRAGPRRAAPGRRGRPTASTATASSAPSPWTTGPAATWAAFWWERRIEPFLRMAVDAGAIDLDDAEIVSELEDQLDELVGPPEPIARLHGDLWSGNVLWADDGRPWLIDPSAYGGRREVDLAMLALFGGLGPRVFARLPGGLAAGRRLRGPGRALPALPAARARRALRRRVRQAGRGGRRPLPLMAPRRPPPGGSSRRCPPRPRTDRGQPGAVRAPRDEPGRRRPRASRIATSRTTGGGRSAAAGRSCSRRPASTRATGRTSGRRWPSAAPTGGPASATAVQAEGALAVAALGHAGGQGSSAYSQRAAVGAVAGAGGQQPRGAEVDGAGGHRRGGRRLRHGGGLGRGAPGSTASRSTPVSTA